MLTDGLPPLTSGDLKIQDQQLCWPKSIHAWEANGYLGAHSNETVL